MRSLQQLIRSNVLDFQPYTSARSEYKGGSNIRLDANENPWGTFNRYPDPEQLQLKQALARHKQVDLANIFIGNGSDEMIDLAFRIFCRPGQDKALIFTPTYGMYEVSARLNDVAVVRLPLTKDFQIDAEAYREALADKDLKLAFLCSPNNPTGNCLDALTLVLDTFDGIVIVDEAYIDFAGRDSLLEQLDRYPHLIVLQTLSKAWGLAGARIGAGYASAAIINLFHRVKPPYNVSTLNQEAALEALSDTATFEQRKAMILDQRRWLEAALRRLPMVKKVYPSDANFLLVEMTEAEQVYAHLAAQGLIVRNRHSQAPGCLRITVGSPSENAQLVGALQQMVLFY
ncbi:histidinol-phosphate transaminase [Taibaiella koreensis]|uniref:histidinol-phosphate transaminase n=1 Tax=Taibaiella koreensis TaxID=1268548 RepID=UPI000E5A03E2|nr:histidinol-phosphate transaminase [Taibaiella koreensis]